MCLMAVTPRRAMITADNLKNAFDHNSDGFGVMYAHGGRVVAWKHKGPYADFAAKWETLPDDKIIAVHFRFGTSGPSNSEACHPFKVLDLDQDGMDLYLMHNGVLDRDHFAGSKKNSDTMQYVGKLRAMLLQLGPKSIRSAEFRALLERELGNPNKIVLLEGNGRWHYLNKHQGKEIDGVWYSNEYSLARVYSGYGKGKAANSTAWDDDYVGQGYYYAATGVNRNDSGHLVSEVRRMDAAYRSTVGDSKDELTWALQIVRVDGREDEQVFWKKGYTGWLRMARNPSTGGFYRVFDKQENSTLVVLPHSCIKFRPKNEKAWERGDRHTWTLEAGEHVPVPMENAVTLYKSSEASAATTPLLDLQDVPKLESELGLRARLCMETNLPCRAGCVDRCTGGEVINASQTFPQSEDGASPSIMATLADFEEAENEEQDDREAAYVEQLFSDGNLRQMTESEMLEAVQDYPEEAAVALGFAHSCPWAFVQEEVA